jgi:hypothetical protein
MRRGHGWLGDVGTKQTAPDPDGPSDECHRQQDDEAHDRESGRGWTRRKQATRRPGTPIQRAHEWPALWEGPGLGQGRLDQGRRDGLRTTSFQDGPKQTVEIECRGHAGCPPVTGERSPAAIEARSARVA